MSSDPEQFKNEVKILLLLTMVAAITILGMFAVMGIFGVQVYEFMSRPL